MQGGWGAFHELRRLVFDFSVDVIFIFEFEMCQERYVNIDGLFLVSMVCFWWDIEEVCFSFGNVLCMLMLCHFLLDNVW